MVRSFHRPQNKKGDLLVLVYEDMLLGVLFYFLIKAEHKFVLKW